MGSNDLIALDFFLGNKQFFHGDCISVTDIIVFSLLANVLYYPHDSLLKRQLASNANLVEFCSMMKDQFSELWNKN